MKAMAVLLFAFLSVALHADVILDNPPPAKPKRRPKPAVVKTETTATTSTTATTTTAVTTTTAAPTPAPAPVTTTTAAPAPAAPVETIPEKRRSTFPFGALTAIGIALVVAITASRRKRQGQ